jgi:uncharacterized SAM-binding protein YcdF (DUF218 family)
MTDHPAAPGVKELPSAQEAARITAYLDVEAPPPGPAAHIIFGTRLTTPAEVVAERYRRGLVPLIVVTGGVNRRTGVVEAHLHRRILEEHGVPASVIRYEDRSTTTGENVELALPFIREALDAGLGLTAVCKWYHRRAIQRLRRLVPEAPGFHAVTWNPTTEGGTPVTRSDWFRSTAAAELVLKEWRVIPLRLAEGTLAEVHLTNGMWQ